MDNFVKGVDLSTLYEMEKRGAKFLDHGSEKEIMELLTDYGINAVRLRLYKNPHSKSGFSYGGPMTDIDTVMNIAERAVYAGMKFNLCITYSDFLTDELHQGVPKDWEGLTIDRLEEEVYDYTFNVLTDCKLAKILPDMVQIGNEIMNGFIWPVGKVPKSSNIARLLNSAIRAIKDVNPGIKIMIGLGDGCDNAGYCRWLNEYLDNGIEFDAIGLSYHPYVHGTMIALRKNMEDLAIRFHKEIYVVETCAGYTMEDYSAREGNTTAERRGYLITPEQAAEAEFPVTPRGQTAFVTDLINCIRMAPDGLGKGFFYFEAATIPVRGYEWASFAGCEYLNEKRPGGNIWANQALFDCDGHMLPVLKTIRDL